MRREPTKLWWTAEELAEARLPDLPGSKRGINQRADLFGWRSQPGCARRKTGRGGGWQYHWSVLPTAAQKKLLLDASAAAPVAAGRDEVWFAFDRLPQSVKDEARNRLETIRKVDAIYGAGETHVSAVHHAAYEAGVSARTVYNWLEMIEGIAEEDRLAYLAPRHRLAKRAVKRGKDVSAFMAFLKSSYLRIAGQTYKQCYRKAVQKAGQEGWETLTERTALRRIEKEVQRVSRVFLREGVAGLERCFPAQTRDRTALGALGGVNADCHKIDVFVEWPDGTINRPQIVAFQDLYSNKFLSWRVDHTPNSVMVMAAFGEMIETWGIPQHCLFDNGREFANKWLTAGTATRFRFKIREDDPLGVLPLLGINVHWAKPAHGQAKPIERAFRDLANDIARDPRFAGAYVGNRPDAKPENYGSRAIPAETFLRVLDEGIAEHNARQGRLTDAALGRSFDETFAESYASVPVRKATEEQRRLWLMGQQICMLNRQNGSIKFNENVYHSEWMSEHPARRVVARFNPEDLWDGLSIYDVDGSYLGFAECQQKVGFFDIASGDKLARRNRKILKAQKALAKAHAELSVDEVSAGYDSIERPAAADLQSKVVSGMFGKKPADVPHQRPSYTPEDNPAVEAERAAIVVRFQAEASEQESAKAQQDQGDPSVQRFWRARDILERSEAGKAVGQEEARWLRDYMETAQYQGLQVLFEQHGKGGVG